MQLEQLLHTLSCRTCCTHSTFYTTHFFIWEIEHELDIKYLLRAKSFYKKPPLQQENDNHFQPHMKQEDLLVLDARRGAMDGHVGELSHGGGFRVYLDHPISCHMPWTDVWANKSFWSEECQTAEKQCLPTLRTPHLINQTEHPKPAYTWHAKSMLRHQVWQICGLSCLRK